MKILLVTTPQLGMKKNRKAKIVRGLLPPLGLAYIAGVLEDNGHLVKILDAPFLGYDDRDIITYAENFNPDILGISIVTPASGEAFKLARSFKKRLPDKKIVLGGPHPTCFPEETINAASEIDVVVAGEGEYVMLELVTAFSSDQDISGIKGIYRRESGRVIKNESILAHQSIQ